MKVLIKGEGKERRASKKKMLENWVGQDNLNIDSQHWPDPLLNYERLKIIMTVFAFSYLESSFLTVQA